MKYALVIPDGCADEPQASLGGRTPLQAAHTPHMDEIAQRGIVGQANHVPHPLPSGSDVGTMSLFGYDPLQYHTGRAPLEAAARGIELHTGDWAIRCNLVTVENDRMRSFTAGQIPSDIAAELIAILQKQCCGSENWKFHAGVSYRNLLIYRARDGKAPFAEDTYTIPPHDITDQLIAEHLPLGSGACDLRALMEKSKSVFQDADPNRRRIASGDLPATQIWLWGQGSKPALTPFETLHGVRGAVITAVDLLRGIGRLIGWRSIQVPGVTGYIDTNYAGKGAAAMEAISGDLDFIVVHIEATDEASHEGDSGAKVEALERIDEHIVGPLHRHLQALGEYRMLVCPDHPTFLRTKTHSHGYVPFAFCGHQVQSQVASSYDELTAAASGLTLERGSDLMELFISS